MDLLWEQRTVTSLLADVLTLRHVAATLPEDDERVCTLHTVAEHRLTDAPPIRPVIAADILGISEPTVRDWANRGILAVRTRKPRLLLEPSSVLKIQELIADLREAGNHSRALVKELYYRLADEQLLADPQLIESLHQLRQGQYEIRRTGSGR